VHTLALPVVGTNLAFKVFPQVEKELSFWRHRAACANAEFSEQALASIFHKRFHCLGGSVYSLFPGCGAGYGRRLVRLIVAYQTISDYLDNLCDRMGVFDPHSFRLVHRSLLAALDSGVEPSGLFVGFGRDDGGYLEQLIRVCREEIHHLPAYSLVRVDALELASLYVDLQVYKHTFVHERTSRLKKWFAYHGKRYPELHWWEFAAASGSTLGVFALFASATDSHLRADAATELVEAYFPYICGLHILLDYLIDQEEDKCNGDLNFVSQYRSSAESRERLVWFAHGALLAAETLKHGAFHRSVTQGLLGMYLSDPKADTCNASTISALIDAGGGASRLMCALCRFLRRRGRV